MSNETILLNFKNGLKSILVSHFLAKKSIKWRYFVMEENNNEIELTEEMKQELSNGKEQGEDE